jgi:hypothetical protein
MGEIPGNDRKKLTVVFVVLLVLLAAGYFLYNVRRSETEKAVNKSKKGELILLKDEKDSQYPAEMKLTMSSDKLKVDSTVEAVVSIDTSGKKAFGSDAILKYDPRFLEVVEGSLKPSDLFDSYPRLETKEKGTIKVTAFGGDKATLNEFKPVFRVTFKAISPGKTKIGFDYMKKGETSGTTVVEKDTSVNILGKVNEAVLEVME